MSHKTEVGNGSKMPQPHTGIGIFTLLGIIILCLGTPLAYITSLIAFFLAHKWTKIYEKELDQYINNMENDAWERQFDEN